jgi:hypothetical protein
MPICNSKSIIVKIRMAGEIIMAVAYGIDVLPSDDPYITLAHKAGRAISSGAVSGAYLVVCSIHLKPIT